jgi:hypothetical protein
MIKASLVQTRTHTCVDINLQDLKEYVRRTWAPYTERWKETIHTGSQFTYDSSTDKSKIRHNFGI